MFKRLRLPKILSFAARKPFLSAVILFLALDGVLFGVLLRENRVSEQGALGSYPQRTLAWGDQANLLGSTSSNYLEVAELASREMSFQDLSVYFRDLAEKKGAAYAYQVLRSAPISPNIDLHLLGHVVGDILYKQQGLEGIQVCTNDFRNACSHSIVVGLFFDKGERALPDIAEACRKAPGGSGAYTMCFHGLGHGILSYTFYDMPKAISLCEKTGTAAYSEREAVECVGGTVMEIIGGGFHDKDLWARMRTKYLHADVPLGLCDGSFIPQEARTQCFVYLTPYLFEAAGANMGNPSPESIKKAFGFCDNLAKDDAATRDACFGGFGKEFVVLAEDRDIRLQTLAKVTDAQLRRMAKWCALAGDKNGELSCLVNATGSLYWGGENDRSIAIRFCGLLDDAGLARSCFSGLTGLVTYYIHDSEYKRTYCEALPSAYRDDCRAKLSVK